MLLAMDHKLFHKNVKGTLLPIFGITLKTCQETHMRKWRPENNDLIVLKIVILVHENLISFFGFGWLGSK